MKIKEGFVLRQMCGENIVAGEGLQHINFNKLLSLNESAAYLWTELVGKEFTADDMAKLPQEYNDYWTYQGSTLTFSPGSIDKN
jgi:hypothetical protein